MEPYTNTQDSLKIKVRIYAFCLEFKGEDRCRIDNQPFSTFYIFFQNLARIFFNHAIFSTQFNLKRNINFFFLNYKFFYI